MKIRDLKGAALDAAVADLLGVDRTVPWDCALAIVTHLRLVRIERPNHVLRVPMDGVDVERKVFVPHETDMEPFEGADLAAQILYGAVSSRWSAITDYYAGRELAKVWKGIEDEADRYLLPAPSYSTSWDAAMQIRTWVARGSLLRRSAFSLQAMLQVATHDQELYQLMSQASADPSMQLFVVTQAGLSMTPADLCRAALVTASEERKAVQAPSGGSRRPSRPRTRQPSPPKRT